MKKPTQVGLVDGVVDGLVDGLGKTDLQIINLIKVNNNISKREMSEKVGISSTAVDKHIVKLKDKGILQRIGSDRYGYWHIIGKIK